MSTRNISPSSNNTIKTPPLTLSFYILSSFLPLLSLSHSTPEFDLNGYLTAAEEEAGVRTEWWYRHILAPFSSTKNRFQGPCPTINLFHPGPTMPPVWEVSPLSKGDNMKSRVNQFMWFSLTWTDGVVRYYWKVLERCHKVLDDLVERLVSLVF